MLKHVKDDLYVDFDALAQVGRQFGDDQNRIFIRLKMDHMAWMIDKDFEEAFLKALNEHIKESKE